jgi:hypothetical protein
MSLVNFLFIPFCAFVWAHLTGLPQRFKWAFKKKSIKPFDCELCISFWVVGVKCYCESHSIIDAIVYGLISGGIANTFYLLYRRFNLI